ncbi:MAG TPA: Plug domain-containing protein, partial [Gemmatimonadaceae bacterium]|nr:Plug domain-containing protein [Gemmatimonadaceae bacterium]
MTQVVVPPGSEVPIPPKAKPDSSPQKTDTIKAPFGRAPTPRTSDIGPQYEWNREELFASGAYTLADLLERVPGATTFRSGWLMTPKFVAMNGALDRVKVIYDGIELDNVDPRTGAVIDLTTIDIWSLESVAIERFANELRVHLRSWRVERTAPYTRTDIYTGDEDTNIYRGFYGKRFDNGAGLQLAGQQFNTRSPRLGGGGDALSFVGRFGIARRMWSIDAFATRRNSSRVLQATFGSGLSIAPFEATQTLAYLRAAVGDQQGGPWAELTASHLRLAESTEQITASQALSSRILADTTDTTTTTIQYVLSAGFVRGPVRASVTERLRAFEGGVRHAPSGRIEFITRAGSIGLFGERDVTLKRNRVDATARFSPLPFIALAGAASLDSPDETLLPALGKPDVSV